MEISRYILSMGGNIIYGGDLRKDGFTYLLYDLVQVYRDFVNTSEKRFYNYLAWPISLSLTKDTKASYSNKITFVEVPPPYHLNINNLEKFILPDTNMNRLIWADSLTFMRNEMENNCFARIFIGGAVKSFKGRLPGTLEEFLIAAQQNKPIYVAGAFGGITKIICDLLQNPLNDLLSETDEYLDFIRYYNNNSNQPKINLEEAKDFIREYGLDKIVINSGLNKGDYVKLMGSKNLTEIIYLILRGLSNRTNI